MNYTPNFANPRVQTRITSALKHAIANLSPTKPRGWGTRQIDKWFGNSRNDISKYLRNQLLICTDHNYRFGEITATKKYCINMQGYNALASKVNMPNILSAVDLKAVRTSSAVEVYGSQIETGSFAYKEKSNRLWNELQNIANEVRVPLFANYGYIYEYDIKSAAPTILYQLARRSGLTRPTPVIDAYLADTRLARQQFADELGVDRRVAKEIITARFASARLGKGNSLYAMLDNNNLAYERLANSAWFAELSKDIKKLWDAIKQQEDYSKLNARIKWDIYFREELRVMKTVHRYLNKNSISFFHEHDGWRSTSAVDIRDLVLYVERHTDYLLDFDIEIFDR